MLNMIKDKINEKKLNWLIADNKEKALMVAKDIANATIIGSGAGQTAKTIKTATKLATCGRCHGVKAVATLTAYAQKTNAIKAAKCMAVATGVKTTVDILENRDRVNNNHNHEVFYDTTANDVLGYVNIDKEEECKNKIRARVLTGMWNMTDAVEYVKRELYSNYDDTFANTLAYQFVLDARK